MEGHGRFFPITILTFQVIKAIGGWWWVGSLQDYNVSPSPIPFPLDFNFEFGTWIWDLYFGLGFGTGLGLDNDIDISIEKRDLDSIKVSLIMKPMEFEVVVKY